MAFSDKSVQTFVAKVVKAFNQPIFSFRKFHETIVSYGKFIKDYIVFGCHFHDNNRKRFSKLSLSKGCSWDGLVVFLKTP